ncbi:MAG: Mth938-like domain-containing protein [Planctomycetota bacterium]
MPIEDYRFGRMRIAGTEYTEDLVLLPGGEVCPGWWRREGHRLSLEDLAVVLESEPEVLVIGTGAFGRMAAPDAVADALRARGVELMAQPTAEAVDTVRGMQGDRRVAAGFHLTC